METAPENHGNLSVVLLLVLSVGDISKGTDYKPTSPLMKEELRKLDEITAQVRYMSEHDISTLSDLHADREKNQTEMDRLTNYRRHLQNKIRRASPAEKEILRIEKNGVTEQITDLRKRLKYADGIEKRSAHIDECLNQIHDTLEKQRSNQNGRAKQTAGGRNHCDERKNSEEEIQEIIRGSRTPLWLLELKSALASIRICSMVVSSTPCSATLFPRLLSRYATSCPHVRCYMPFFFPPINLN